MRGDIRNKLLNYLSIPHFSIVVYQSSINRGKTIPQSPEFSSSTGSLIHDVVVIVFQADTTRVCKAAASFREAHRGSKTFSSLYGIQILRSIIFL